MKTSAAVLALTVLLGMTPVHAAGPGCSGTAPQQQTCSFSFIAAKDIADIKLRAPATAGVVVATYQGGGRHICTQLDSALCVFVGNNPSAGQRFEGTVAAVGSGKFSIEFIYEN